jgi:predicted dehydrogenase
MIRLGLIGFGFWGPILARNFTDTPGVSVDAVCDADADRRADARRRCPGARVNDRADEVLTDPALDAVAISTPAATHHSMALAALRAGKHVFVEKPLATTVDEAEGLVEEAAKRHLVLMVDHTFLFAPPVKRLTELVRAGDLGTLLYYDSVRIALGRFQDDVNVLWDLAVHDLAVLDQLASGPPLAISALGAAHWPDQREDIAFVTLTYADSFIAHLHVNWLAPVKVRRTLVGGSLRTALWDDLEPSERLRIYDSGVISDEGPEGIVQRRIGYRVGDIWSPRLEVHEALEEATAEFAGAIAGGRTPRSDGECGLRVVRMLAAATRSLALSGAPVELNRSPRASGRDRARARTGARSARHSGS